MPDSWHSLEGVCWYWNGRHSLEVNGFDQITIGRQTFPLAEGFDHFAAMLGEYFPHEKDGLRQYVKMLEHLPPMEEISQVGAYNYLKSLFHDPLLINVLSGTATFQLRPQHEQLYPEQLATERQW